MWKKSVVIWIALIAAAMCTAPMAAFATPTDIEVSTDEGNATPALSAAAQNVEQSEELKEKYKVVEACGSGFVYSDDMLLRDARILNTDVAKASVVMAEASYDDNGDSDGKPSTELLRRILVDDMGFEDFQDYGSYDLVNNNINVRDNDYVGFAVARKEVGDNVIYCVPIKGTGGNSEWFSDFNLGDPDSNGGWHEGFLKASNHVKAGLINSLNRNSAADAGKTRILWFLGHSRGAAVANLLAGQLSDTQSLTTRDHIFCYTFACPSVGYDENVAGYPNIVNYNNAGDLIPMLPMENDAWGFSRYGRTETISLMGIEGFQSMRQALYGRGYHGAVDQTDWQDLIERFFPNKEVYEGNRFLFDIIAYGLGGCNDNNFWEDFYPYMKDTYNVDLQKMRVDLSSLGSDQDVFHSLQDIFNNTLENDRSDEEAIDELYYRLVNAEDEEEYNAIINEGNPIFPLVLELSNMDVINIESVSLAHEAMIRTVDALEPVTNSVVSFVHLLDTSDEMNPRQILDDGHRCTTYICWINTWFCGYRSWQDSDLSSPASDSDCRISLCTTIGPGSFSGSGSLESISFRDDLRYIGDNAFNGCSSLGSVVIPASVECLGENAFEGCVGLTEVSLPVELSGFDAFKGCENVATIHYTANSTGVMPDREPGYESSIYYEKTLEYTCRENLKTVEFGEGVTHIGAFSFSRYDWRDSDYESNGALETVILPETLVSIGNCAFYGDWAMDLRLPSSLQSLGYECFAYSGITELDIPAGLTEIPRGCFHHCGNLTSLVIPNTVTQIDQDAFERCGGLTEVTLPVELDGFDIFEGCDHVTTIHYTANSTGVMPDREPGYESPVYYEKTLEYTCRENLKTVEFGEGVTHIGAFSFSRYDWRDSDYESNGALETVILPETLVSIGSCAFYGDWAMDLRLPSSLQSLGYECFAYSGITELDIPAGITEIPRGCFHHCGNLTSLVIPNTVTQIDQDAFEGCGGLTEVTLPVELDGFDIFEGCDHVTTIHYTANSTGVMPDREPGYESSIYYEKTLEYTCRENLKTVEFGEGVTHIGAFSFSRYDWRDSDYESNGALETVTLPETLVSIGSCAFYGDWAMDLRLPSSLQSLGYECFAYSGITELDIPAGLTEIPRGCFHHCGNLTSLVIPNTVTQIDQDAFEGCGGLTEVTLPVELDGFDIFEGCDHVTTIHYTANSTGVMPDREPGYESPVYYEKTLEYTCRENLKTVEFGEGVTHIGAFSFSRYDWRDSDYESNGALETVTLPETLVSIGSCAFYGDWAMDLRLPSSLQSLGDECFAYSGITELDIPAGLTEIPWGCFHHCENLTSLVIPNTVTQIDQDAFEGCGGLEEITFNGDAPEIADSIFDYVSADVWVFGIADSWTPENRPDLGGTLTWHYFEDTWTQRLTLPNNLKLIEDQAFQNTVAKMVILPDGVSYIGSKAFGDSEELCAVLLPEGNINIAADAFEGSEVIIFAPAGSAAEAFAEAHGIDFFASEWQNRLDSIQQ